MMQVSKVVLPAQCILSFMCLTYIQCASSESTTNDDSIKMTTPLHRTSSAPHHSHRYQVAKFDFENVSTPYIISLWIIIVGLAKIGESFFCFKQNIMFYNSIDSPIIQFSIIFHILILISH
jgi:hypothetical protein